MMDNKKWSLGRVSDVYSLSNHTANIRFKKGKFGPRGPSYPFREMSPGQLFYIYDADDGTPALMESSVRSYCYKYGREMNCTFGYQRADAGNAWIIYRYPVDREPKLLDYGNGMTAQPAGTMQPRVVAGGVPQQPPAMVVQQHSYGAGQFQPQGRVEPQQKTGWVVQPPQPQESIPIQHSGWPTEPAVTILPPNLDWQAGAAEEFDAPLPRDEPALPRCEDQHTWHSLIADVNAGELDTFLVPASWASPAMFGAIQEATGKEWTSDDYDGDWVVLRVVGD